MRRLTLVVVAATVIAAIAWALLDAGPSIPEGSVLSLELGGEFEEAPPTDALAQLLASGPALPTLLLQLEKAAADERIAGVLLHIKPFGLGWARTQELRDAIERLRESNKPVVALLDLASLNATRELFVASAASHVYVVPGYLGPLAGISGEFMFLAGFLDKVGVQVEYERVGRYKSAVEMFAAKGMSDPARENANALFDGIYEQLVRGFATGRGIAPERVRELIAEAPGTADELVSSGLVDAIAERRSVLKTAGLEGAEEVGADVYLHVDPRDLGLRDGPKIALVFGDGTIVSGRGAREFGADRVSEALDQAGEDESIQAVVLRINSGGGSSLASDQVWQAVQALREKKPVVISMADAAASGGYYVASAGTSIVAQPATLTGSIGIFFMRPSYRGLYEKLGIQTEAVTRGGFAAVLSGSAPLTSEQRERSGEFMRALYGDFLERVSAGRGLSVEEVDRLGQGQVWLGEAALENGLIDELGGLHAAVERAKREASIDAGVDPTRVVLPGPRNLGRQIRDLMQGELRVWLARTLLPDGLHIPERLRAIAAVWSDGGLAYLPGWWIDFD